MESREKQFILDTEKYDKSPNVILANKELTATEKQLLIKIINLSGKTGYCFATQETLGNHLGKSKDTIKKTISSLRKKGYIRTESNGQTFKHNNITYPIYEKIFNGKYAENLEIKGTPKKEDFIPKPKEDLIDYESEVYLFNNSGNEITDFENFWIHKRQVVNLRRTTGRYINEIAKKFIDLFYEYVRDLAEEKVKEGRNLIEDNYYERIHLGGNEENRFNEEKIKEFQRKREITALPWFWLTQEEFNSRNIREVVLNKLIVFDKVRGKEHRKELRESNKEIEKERQEVIEKEYKYMLNEAKKFEYLDKDYKEKVVNEMQDLLEIMIKDIYDNYLIYNPWYYYMINKRGEYQDIRTKALSDNYENQKKLEKEKKKLAKQEKEIQDKKEEIEEIKKGNRVIKINPSYFN